MGRQVAAEAVGILVSLPNGETRMMSAGSSTVISKAVIENFAARFLKSPGVVFLNESGNKGGSAGRQGGFDSKRVAFVTDFADRRAGA